MDKIIKIWIRAIIAVGAIQVVMFLTIHGVISLFIQLVLTGILIVVFIVSEIFILKNN